MRRILKISVLTLALPMLVIGGYIAYILATGNFHAITPGEAYRSAQLDGKKLEHYISEYNIRSILNLRGKNDGKQWYKDEVNVSATHSVAHYDIALSSSKEPKAEDVRRLIEIFKSAPRPILIHCQFGADRSGLVAAMWKVIIDKEPRAEAKKQLSLFYGHFPVMGRQAMDRFFQEWTP